MKHPIHLPEDVEPLDGWTFRLVGDRWVAHPDDRPEHGPVVEVSLRPDIAWTDDEDSEEPDEMTVEEADAELTDAWLPLYRAWNDERLATFATRLSRELGL